MRTKVFYTVIAIILTLVVLGVGMFLFRKPVEVVQPAVAPPVLPPPPPAPIAKPDHEVIGKSVEGRTIEVYTYGSGPTHLLFVGGMHGGYEWNSVVLSYAFMDYLKAHPEFVPANITIAVVPSLNPDGVYKVVQKEGRFDVSDVPKETGPEGKGRANAHDVDLNRNFDCKWSPKGTWRSHVVSAGSGPFSEPESAALRDYIATFDPEVVVFWHSQSNAVYASECKNGILPETLAIMNAYARASGYAPVKSFDAYEVHGDAEGWLASIDIPAITVELKTHETVEWERNLLGITALVKHFETQNDTR